MSPLFARLGIAVAISGIFAGSTQALPGSVRTDHPRLYASVDDLRRLIAQVPLLNPALPEDADTSKAVVFPNKRGRLAIKFQPSKLTDADGEKAFIFGDSTSAAEGIYVRYVSSDDRNAVLQLGVKALGAPGLIAANFPVTLDVATNLEVEWQADTSTVTFRVGNAEPVPRTLPATFNASNQPFVFGGRRGDQMPEFRLFDGSGNLVRGFVRDNANPTANNGVDLEMFSAWQGLLSQARYYSNKFAGCVPTNALEFCRLTAGGRFDIIGPAKLLVLAYRLTGDRTFLEGARNHLKLIYALNAGVTIKGVETNAGTGGEWSMSARVGAMGIYYDWLYASLLPQEKTDLRAAITQTVSFDNAGSDDLRYSICGSAEFSGMACAKDWRAENGPAEIARQYITGHAPTAQFNTVLGLLAIQNEESSIDGLIDTIYRHFHEGFVPARAAISYPLISAQELKAKPWLKYSSWGGHQTLFSYNASSVGELPERLKVWQRALNLDTRSSELEVPWLSNMFSPYIYGLRGDGNFPAGSDNVTYKLGNFVVSELALAAAQNGDAIAHGFYRTQVLGKRALINDRSLWERLMFGVPTAAPTQSPEQLPLSAQYPVAGNVLIRNSWDYPNAALLDFKSTSFISVNHHHYDQNSFSLFYKAPLLIDSGQYDSYGSAHWKHYYGRTIAHNSIVLFDDTEQFVDSWKKTWANDGGQWIDGRIPIPLVEELTGDNKLDGVTAYEEGGWYAYTEGNATKAYKRGKLNPDARFVRSIVYLRPDGRPKDEAAKATVVVFDKVRTATKALVATSLLHMVKPPVANGAPAGSAGRYTYPFASDESTFTVRNGVGMATIQALLPKGGKAVLVGGMDNTKQCKQVGLDKNQVEVVMPPTSDCRYLTRGLFGGVFDWYNFAPVGSENVSADNGNWRLEFSPAATPTAGTAQYFLNVIRVADSDNLTGTVTLSDEQNAVLVDTGYETVGVQIGSDRRIIFNGGTQQNMWPVWQPGDFRGTTLVVGLVPNHCYGLIDQQGKKALKPDVSCDYKSSDGGVITIQ